ncbi:MAG: SDR family NAD(P)-dependent oxidoreductase [Halolamina sp.]
MVEEPPFDLQATEAAYPGLDGSTVVVTGASNGIGRATSAVLAASGATVYGLDIAAEPADGGPRFDAVVDQGELVVGDVTDAEVVDSFVQAAAEDGGLDAVVNNAGITTAGSLEEVAPDDWREIFNVHVDGTYNVCRSSLPVLQERGHGSIINISSIAALGSYTGSAAYSSAKGAIIGLTRQLAADYSPEGIRVNAVAPGFIRTRMNEAIWRDERGDVRDDFDDHPLMQRTLLSYPGDPVDIGHMIGYLCSDAGRFITGQVIPVDGGWST